MKYIFISFIKSFLEFYFMNTYYLKVFGVNSSPFAFGSPKAAFTLSLWGLWFICFLLLFFLLINITSKTVCVYYLFFITPIYSYLNIVSLIKNTYVFFKFLLTLKTVTPNKKEVTILSHPKYDPSIKKTTVIIKKYTSPIIHKYLWFFKDIKSPKKFLTLIYVY